jgi:hypothetical protein
VAASTRPFARFVAKASFEFARLAAETVRILTRPPRVLLSTPQLVV